MVSDLGHLSNDLCRLYFCQSVLCRLSKTTCAVCAFVNLTCAVCPKRLVPFVPSPFPLFLDLMIYANCNLVAFKENLLPLLCTHVIISNIRCEKYIKNII